MLLDLCFDSLRELSVSNCRFLNDNTFKYLVSRLVALSFAIVPNIYSATPNNAMI